MQLLTEILEKMKGYVLPRSNSERNAPSYDGQYDPLGDEELLTIEKRGSFLKDTNGKLYYPSKDGYQRTKTVIPYPSEVLLTTTNDTVVAVAAVPSTVGSVNSNKILVAYQNSGAPLVFSIYVDNGKTQLIYSESVPNAVATVLGCRDLSLGSVYIAWAGAAGATQYVIRSREYLAAVAVN